MAKIITEERNGITCRYVEAQDGIRVYLLPNVPVDVGEIEVQEDYDEATVNGFMDKVGFSSEQRERGRRIVGNYRGRQMDTLSVLGYAQEQGRFDEFAQRLEERHTEWRTVHSDLMYSRTDITAFFLGLYAALGKAPREEATKARELAENYGPGVVVLPKKK
jgi:hypothetical protein